VVGTTPASGVKVVTAGKWSETTVGHVSVSGDLKYFTAATTDLLDSFSATGWVGTVEFDDVADQHTITLGPAPWSRPKATTALVFDEVQDLSVTSQTPLRLVKATRWLDTDGTPDEIVAPRIGELRITGKRGSVKKGILPVSGDFQAGLTLAGHTRYSKTIGKATIAGNLSDAAWDITKDVGPIIIDGDATDWDLNVHSNVTKVVADYFTDVAIAVDGALTTLKGIAFNGGSVDIRRLKYLKMLGTKTDTTDPSGFNADLTVGSLYYTLVKYGDYAGVTSDGNIGSTTVFGGNIVGSMVSNLGTIGSILVKAYAAYDKATNSATVTGGSFLGEQLHAQQNTRGKSIGNVLCIGGSFGDPGAEVEVRAPGDVGKVQAKKLRYKESMVGRKSVYTYQGGGIWTDLNIGGRLASLLAQGNDIDGTIDAAEGMGGVKAEGILLQKDGSIAGTSYTTDATKLLPAHVKASLTGGLDAFKTAVSSITVIGGSILGDLDVIGKVGDVLVKAFAHWDGATETVTFTGGGIESSVFEASRFGKITTGPGKFSADVKSDTKIGSVVMKGSEVTGSLTAQDAIGAITYVRTYLNAGGIRKWKDAGVWDWLPSRGMLFGAPVDLAIHLGQDGAGNPSATLGKITSTGADVTLTGEVPFDPALVKIVSKPLRYIDDYTVSPSNRLLPVYATVGGGVNNGLVQA